MKKTVVLVGHCGPDSSYLRISVSSADRELQVVMADDSSELKAQLARGVDLILFNRELGWGFEQTMGVDAIAALKKTHPQLKTMLVSNYPDAQAAALAAGAEPGFGKREIGSKREAQVIRAALGLETAAATSQATGSAR